MANRRFTQFFHTLHAKPVLLDCNFVVSATDSGGYGITSLKGPGIQNVFMHTSATAASGNPNPGNGVILVKLQDTYNKFYGMKASIRAPASGTPILVASAGVTNHLTYVITVVGTTTTAGWQSLGLPVGITPAVGVSFVATATTTASGTGAVQVIATAGSGIDHIELFGDPNLTIASSAAHVSGVSSGAYLIAQCFSAGTVTAPAAGTVIGLSFYLGNSSVLVQGE